MKSTESPWNFFEDFENEEEGELKRILLEKGSDEMLYIDEQTKKFRKRYINNNLTCLLYTSPSPRDSGKSRMPSSA